MVSILIGVQTNDERQNATEALGKALRAGMEKQQADYAADAVPTSFGTGLYGAAIHSHAARARSESGPEADRRSWRRARQVGNHTPSRDASVHSKGRNESLDPGVDGRSDYGSRTSERVRRHTTDGEVSLSVPSSSIETDAKINRARDATWTICGGTSRVTCQSRHSLTPSQKQRPSTD